MQKMVLTLAAGLSAVMLATAVQAAPNVAEVKANAEKGVVESQYLLGSMYLKGNGVKKNPKLALKWFEKAAAQNNAMAQLKLGFMYEDGTGVKQDKKKARVLYEIACKNYHELGCNYAQRLKDEGY